jgi:hypothetical protein
LAPFLGEAAPLGEGQALRIVAGDRHFQLARPSLAGPPGDGLIQCRARAAAALPGEHGDERNDTASAIGEDSPDPGPQDDIILADEAGDVILGTVPV